MVNSQNHFIDEKNKQILVFKWRIFDVILYETIFVVIWIYMSSFSMLLHLMLPPTYTRRGHQLNINWKNFFLKLYVTEFKSDFKI